MEPGDDAGLRALPRKSSKLTVRLEMPNPTVPSPEPRPPGNPHPEPSPFSPVREPDWEPGPEQPPGPVIDPMPGPVEMEHRY